MRVVTLVGVCILYSFVLLCTEAFAVDRVLTIGGGYAPEGNQASL